MKIVEDKEIKVFRHNGEYGISYSIGISKKTKDGQYENGYMPCKFKKDVEVEDKSKIIIKDAWLSFNLKDKKTYSFIFINDFDKVEEKQEKVKVEEPKTEGTKVDPFENMGRQVRLDEIDTEEDLPF